METEADDELMSKIAADIADAQAEYDEWLAEHPQPKPLDGYQYRRCTCGSTDWCCALTCG